MLVVGLVSQERLKHCCYVLAAVGLFLAHAAPSRVSQGRLDCFTCTLDPELARLHIEPPKVEQPCGHHMNLTSAASTSLTRCTWIHYQFHTCSSILLFSSSVAWFAQKQALCVQVVAFLDKPVRWTSPLGFPIEQPYRKDKHDFVRTGLQVRKHTIIAKWKLRIKYTSEKGWFRKKCRPLEHARDSQGYRIYLNWPTLQSSALQSTLGIWERLREGSSPQLMLAHTPPWSHASISINRHNCEKLLCVLFKYCMCDPLPWDRRCSKLHESSIPTLDFGIIWTK